MNILIAGGTGYIGRKLAKQLLESGNEITILTRNKENASEIFSKKIKIISWIDIKSNPLKISFNHYDSIINLSGESIAARKWDLITKERIISSRIKSTKRIITALENKVLSTSSLINSSAIGYYGAHSDKEITESELAGNDFLADVCKQWEEEAMKAEKLGVRVVRIRTGVVFGEVGALQKMIIPYTFFLGGPIGNGKQWLSWIHISDLVNVYIYAINNINLSGAINATAPNPVNINYFSKALGKVMHRPSFFRVPAFIIRFIFGELADTLLKGQKVIPEKLQESSFRFSFPALSDALEDILKK